MSSSSTKGAKIKIENYSATANTCAKYHCARTIRSEDITPEIPLPDTKFDLPCQVQTRQGPKSILGNRQQLPTHALKIVAMARIVPDTQRQKCPKKHKKCHLQCQVQAPGGLKSNLSVKLPPPTHILKIVVLAQSVLEIQRPKSPASKNSHARENHICIHAGKYVHINTVNSVHRF